MMRMLVGSRSLAASLATVLLLGVGQHVMADTIIYSNNTTPGDWVVGSGGSPGVSAAVGSSGWKYQEVRQDGAIGITSNHAFNGNGSVLMQTTSTSGKAEIELVNLAGFGKLKDLNAFSYSWYRDAASTADAWTGPVARLLISNGVQTGYLISEQYFTGYHPGSAPTNTWVTTDSYNGGNGQFSTYGGALGQPSGINAKFSTWVNGGSPLDGGLSYGDFTVIGINLGIGSGLGGTLIGAADNITLGFTGEAATTYNFEVAAVPEPSGIVLSAMGVVGLLGFVHRRRRAATA